MIMINRVLAVAVQGRTKVYLKPVAVAVIGNHPGMVMECFGDARNMGQAGQDRPADQRQTQKCRHDPPCECLPCPRHESLPETLAARVRCRLVLSSPGG